MESKRRRLLSLWSFSQDLQPHSVWFGYNQGQDLQPTSFDAEQKGGLQHDILISFLFLQHVDFQHARLNIAYPHKFEKKFLELNPQIRSLVLYHSQFNRYNYKLQP